MAGMVCVICGRGPREGVSVFRINEKGVPGLWACRQHIKQTDGTRPDENLLRVVEAIEKHKP